MAGTNFIKRELTITIKDKVSVLDEKLYLFQNDRNIDLYFTIMNFKFDFLAASQSVENIVEKTNACYSTIRVLKPNGEKFISNEKLPIEDNKVLFTITREFIDEVKEIGIYKLQISLYDNQQGKITIPYIEFEVLEPIFPEDFVEEYITGQIDITRIGESLIGDTPSEAGVLEINNRIASVMGTNSGLIKWSYGDIISAERMNTINENIDNIWDKIDKLLEAVDKPPTFTNPTLSIGLSKTVIEHNTLTNITITPTFKQNDSGGIINYKLAKGSTILVDSSRAHIYTDSVTLSHNSSITYTATITYLGGASKTSTFGIEYPGIKAGSISANATARAYALSYYGVIDESSITDISVLSSRLGTSRGYTATYNMTKQRSVYMYPKSFGALSSIKDANNFEYINSYSRNEMTYDNVDYYVYILTDPVTITGFKQVFS